MALYQLCGGGDQPGFAGRRFEPSAILAFVTDADGDGLSDVWESANGLNPTTRRTGSWIRTETGC